MGVLQQIGGLGHLRQQQIREPYLQCCNDANGIAADQKWLTVVVNSFTYCCDVI
jgi:hypothetical protein